MFYEKLEYKVDIEKLKKEVRESVFTLGDKVIQGEEFETPKYNGFGGWSLLSKNASWTDGWEAIQLESGMSLESFLPTQELIYKAYKYFNISHGLEHDKPTEAYVGEIKKVLDDLRDLGFWPCRARVTCLKAGSKSLVHKDADTSEYMARIHIPLWTNKKCVHICNGEHLRMAADGGVYILWTNRWHQIRNDSNEDRYHIIMDAYDTKKITNFFKYEGDFEMYQNYIRGQREKIDAVEVTDEDVDFFEALKQGYVTK
jgi:Aspartyl/Asparaginyl beta-hydroxylase